MFSGLQVLCKGADCVSSSNNNGGALPIFLKSGWATLLANQKAKRRLIAERHNRGGCASFGAEQRLLRPCSSSATGRRVGVLMPRALNASAI
jgi:hypothetical protein